VSYTGTSINVFRSIPIIEMPGFAGDVGEAARTVLERVETRRGGYACLFNIHGLVLAQRDLCFREALERAWTLFPDGWPVAWLQRSNGAPVAARIPGTDLMMQVFALGEKQGLSHFLFGSSPQVLVRIRERMLKMFPEADVAGSFSPPYGPLDEVDFRPSINAIRAASPDIVWCGLGAPKQELWMSRYASEVAPALVLGVGAAFDFVAGTKQRAPRWSQRAGLEWLHRLGSEPRRLAGRYAVNGLLFFWYASSWLVRNRTRLTG
jgi:N-acetylglucosaminyldiphosphoundecaprenol N-acetyl-beta-D-mannosaminyltransferase